MIFEGEEIVVEGETWTCVQTDAWIPIPEEKP
jgi:hypothetical protein